LEDKLSNSQDANYAVLIDAGSSGSRVYLYTWLPHSGDIRKLLQIKMMTNDLGQILFKTVTPGLSSFASNPEKAFDYIYPLIEYAAEQIPTAKHKEVPFYILATAGMRLLSNYSQNAILNNIRSKLAVNSTFLFSDNNIQVISGKEEGIYSWISVNYLLGRFDHSFSTPTLVSINLGNEITTRARTAGMLEMGGASFQVAFEVISKYDMDEIKRSKNIQDEKAAKSVFSEFNLGCTNNDGHHNYLLFVSTFLGVGANIANKIYWRFLLAKRIEKMIFTPLSLQALTDPCLCKNCALNQTIISLDNIAYNITLKGVGDYSNCEALLEEMLDSKIKHLCGVNTSCPFDDLKSTRIFYSGSEFFGFSELWYSMEDVLKIGGRYDYFKLKKAAKEYCSTDYSVLKKRLDQKLYSNANEERILSECFKVAWISTVLHSGLKMPKTYKNYQSAFSINHNLVQWTLGALLYRTRFFPLRTIEADTSSDYFIAHTPASFYAGHFIFLLCILAVLSSIVIYLKHLNIMVNKGSFSMISDDNLKVLQVDPRDKFYLN